MKKFLEQRVEELELEVKLLRAKIKLNETVDTSKYINKYPSYDPSKIYDCDGNLNSMSKPHLATAFACPFDKSDFDNFLDTVTIKTPVHSDADIEDGSSKQNYVCFHDYPEYPDIWGSFDANPEDIITEDHTPFANLGFISDFDKMDKDFLKWIKSNEAKESYQVSRVQRKNT